MSALLDRSAILAQAGPPPSQAKPKKILTVVRVNGQDQVEDDVEEQTGSIDEEQSEENESNKEYRGLQLLGET